MSNSQSPSTGSRLAVQPTSVHGDELSLAIRHFGALAALILALAAFNLTFRIGQTAITEWDESLYGLSAAEMLETGDWVATRLNGQVDYTVITKPPLLVWLTALSFQTFGITPEALRLSSVASAWLTVFILIVWARRAVGPTAALAAGAVLATSFGFMFVHSGRTGNTDALFALLTTLIAVVLAVSLTHPWARLALGPVLSAAFLLRGPGALMLLAIVILVEARHRRASHRWLTLTGAALVFAVAVGSWAYARWRFDEWRFLSQLWNVDLVTRTLTAFEGHAGTPFYYLDILQRYQYEWLIAAVIAVVLYAPQAGWRKVLSTRGVNGVQIVIAAWALTTFMVPTLMQTKLSWYLNPFYPVAALLIGVVIRNAAVASNAGSRRRKAVLAVTLAVAWAAAEGKMLYQVYRRDKSHFLQGMLERERALLAGQTIYRTRWNGAEYFVATRIVQAKVAALDDPRHFARVARPGDFLVAPTGLSDHRLERVGEGAGEGLYRLAR
jgi:4-amino-4-deoxy-L-arabinose transferase-like glycosyltransferase